MSVLAALLMAAAAASPGIQYVGGTTAAPASTSGTISLTSLTGGIGSEPVAGDLVIVNIVATSSAADDNLAVTTAGYTEVADLYSNDTVKCNQSVSWKIMGGSPDTDVAIDSDTGRGAVVVQVYRGVNPTTPMDVTPTTATGINTDRPDPPSITPAGTYASGVRVLIAGGGSASSAGAVTALAFGTPANWQNILQVQALSGGGANGRQAIMGMVAPASWSSGAINPAALTGGQNAATDSWCAVSIALRPA